MVNQGAAFNTQLPGVQIQLGEKLLLNYNQAYS